MQQQEHRCRICGTLLCKEHNGQLHIGDRRNVVTVTPQNGTAEAVCRNGHKNSIDVKKPNR